MATILLSLSVTAAAQTPPSDSPLVLQQLLNGEITCVSPDATCSTVDLYGIDGSTNPTPLQPGDRLNTTVQLRNAGSVAASGLDLAAGPCENRPASGETATADLCGTVTVAVACGTGGTAFSLAPQSLTSFGQGGSHTVSDPLAPGASATCSFTVTYPDDAPLIIEALRAVQPITWTLVAPDAPTPPSPGDASPGPGPGTRGPLAFTGGDAFPLALAGLALLVVGGVLHWWSRRDAHDGAEASLPEA